MLESTRDRIVGGVFLLAVAGILLPMWFDGAGVADLPPVEVSVPPLAAPNAPTPADREEDWAFVRDAEQHATRGPVAAGGTDPGATVGQPRLATAPPAAAASPLPETPDAPVSTDFAWAVQVASLGSRDAAKTLKDRLIAKELHAFVTEVRSADGATTQRVAVGPFIDRGEAERVRERIRRDFGLEGLVVRRFGL